MSYIADYLGYELGYFLPPRYQGNEKGGVFFLLLQNPNPDKEANTFCIKLGKTRFLEGPFFDDSLRVLGYFEVDSGQFSVHPINLKTKKGGTKYFDAEDFLKQMGVEFEITDTSHYRYFKSRLDKNRREIIMKEDCSEFSIIHRRINADDFESLAVHRNTRNALKSAYFFTTRG